MGPAEKFESAICALARSGPIKDRVTDAWRNHLAAIDDEELPAELRDEFRALTQALTREQPLSREEDACRATVRKMSSEQADEVATRMVRLYGVIARCPPQWAKVPKLSPQVVPLFAAEA